MVSLIARLQDAEPGMVLIDGAPIRSFPLAELRANIGFVPQETFLFSETIRHNISFGAPQVNRLADRGRPLRLPIFATRSSSFHAASTPWSANAA